MVRTKLVFVGGLNKKGRSSVKGGQYTASTLFINELAKYNVTYRSIDTIAYSNLEYIFFLRFIRAIARFVRLVYLLIFFRPNSILIFTSNGWSLKEKILMGEISQIFGVKVSLFLRSGAIYNEVCGNVRLRRRLSRAENVLVQGDYWKDRYLKILSTNVVSVLNWVEVKEDYKRRKRNSKIKVISFIGWINDNKGVALLLSSFYDLLKEGYDLKLNIAGDGPLREELESFVTISSLDDKVTFYGWVNEDTRRDILEDTDLIVLPSLSEGMPNVILEALSYDLICMGTDIGGLRDIIYNCGGHFCNREFLTRDMRNILDLEWDFTETGRLNREYLSQFHSLSNIKSVIAVL